MPGLVTRMLFSTVQSVAMFLAAGRASMITQGSCVLCSTRMVMAAWGTRTSDRTFLRTCVLFEVENSISGCPSLIVCPVVVTTVPLIHTFTDLVTKLKPRVVVMTGAWFTLFLIISTVLPLFDVPRVVPRCLGHPPRLSKFSGLIIGLGIPILAKMLLLNSVAKCVWGATGRRRL